MAGSRTPDEEEAGAEATGGMRQEDGEEGDKSSYFSLCVLVVVIVVPTKGAATEGKEEEEDGIWVIAVRDGVNVLYIPSPDEEDDENAGCLIPEAGAEAAASSSISSWRRSFADAATTMLSLCL